MGTTPQPDELPGDGLTVGMKKHQPSEARGSTEPPSGTKGKGKTKSTEGKDLLET